MEFLAATNNAGKLAEIRRILAAEGHSVLSLADAGITSDVAETGETFAENALLKAAAGCRASGLATIADDSGLEVDALGGEPGVRSARYAGRGHNDEANNRKLLRAMERVPYLKRTARFVCVIALAMPDGSGIEVEGRCQGLIGFAPSGAGGFGYDPLFYVGEKSFADMDEQEKDAISHRAVALRRFACELPGFLKTPRPAARQNQAEEEREAAAPE